MDGLPKSPEKTIAHRDISITALANSPNTICDEVTQVDHPKVSCYYDNTATGFEDSIFISWKNETISTICNQLSGPQRSTFLFELLGQLPANNRLFLVRNIEKIAAVDFIRELPIELSLCVLSYLDPVSLLSASQVSRHWDKLIRSECSLWQSACLYLGISLPYTTPHPSFYYRSKVLSYFSNVARLKKKEAWSATSVSDVPAHASRVLGLTANSCRIYSGGDDRAVRSWDCASQTLLAERQSISASCLDCTESRVAVGLYNGCILVFDTQLSRDLGTCSRHMGPVYDVKWAPDTTTLVSGSSDCTVRVWDMAEEGACVHVFRGHETMINRILLMCEVDLSRICSLDISCINVWCVTSKEKLASLRPLNSPGKEGYLQPGLLQTRYLNSNTRHTSVIVCGSNSGIYLWDAHSYHLLKVIHSEGYVCAEHVVAAGSAFLVTTYDDGLALLEVSTGDIVCRIGVSQFNNSSCSIWINKENPWLDGVFTETSSSLFIVTTLAGDITSYALR